ncbi:MULTISPECIES: alpha/beta hydrolase family protein [Pseudoalteromonas]|uniref:Peptidase S9 n=1 Tax=Pseudoalteromonas amylolytica TaxID=1859457 RepID=A0A1S1MTK8_9GAMM|nr:MULTISPECIES: S9 family peptidase [Pseudoalteromonas]OHU86700.1 peptidase S9 [Pseudoalteromonas sp. JW3]OHU88776.1 peptidase S9 [Pseudoalteromonas amylolytica]
MTTQLTTFKRTLLGTAMAVAVCLTGCQGAAVLTNAKTASVEQQSALIQMEDLFDKAQISRVKLSKDGRFLVFLKTLNGANNLFIVPKGGKASEAVALTQLKDPVDSYAWSSRDGELFFFKDHQGDENTQLFSLKFDVNDLQKAPKITKLTTNPNAQFEFIQQLSEQPQTLVVKANHSDIGRLDVYHLNADTLEFKSVHTNTLFFADEYINEQGEVVLGLVKNKDNTRTLYRKNNGQWHKVLTTLQGEDIDFYHFDKDTNTALVSANIEGRDKEQLLSLNLSNGVIEPIHQDPKNESDLEKVILDDNGAPYLVTYYGDRLRNYPLQEEAKQQLAVIESQFSDEDVDILINKIDHEKGHWDISITSSVQPRRRFVYEAQTQKLVDLLNKAPKIAPELLSPKKTIYYTARDGEQIQAYLTLPKQNAQNLPTIVLPHGGPWARDHWAYDSDYFNPIAHYFANRGYAVLQANYRGSIGFGKRFTLLGERNWGTGHMQHDLTDGVNYLVEQGIADKNRVGILGASYGGYAALSGAAFTPDVYKAVISYVGPSSLITLVESFPERFRPYLGDWFKAVGDPLIEADRQDMASRSPINFVDDIKAPLMLLQGANDPRVTKAESDNIARALYQAGSPVKYYLAKDEGHGFLKRENKLASIRAMEEFFAQHLGGRMSNNVSAKTAEQLAKLEVDISKL